MHTHLPHEEVGLIEHAPPPRGGGTDSPGTTATRRKRRRTSRTARARSPVPIRRHRRHRFCHCRRCRRCCCLGHCRRQRPMPRRRRRSQPGGVYISYIVWVRKLIQFQPGTGPEPYLAIRQGSDQCGASVERHGVGRLQHQRALVQAQRSCPPRAVPNPPLLLPSPLVLLLRGGGCGGGSGGRDGGLAVLETTWRGVFQARVPGLPGLGSGNGKTLRG